MCLPPIYYTKNTLPKFINEQPHLLIEIRKKVCNNSTAAEQYLNYTQYKSLSVNTNIDDLDFIYIHSFKYIPFISILIGQSAHFIARIHHAPDTHLLPEFLLKKTLHFNE